MKKLVLAVAIVSLGAVAIIATAIAKNGNGGGHTFHAKLNGYNEIVGGPGAASTGSVSTGATGIFKAKVKRNPLRVEFTLTYEDIEGGTVTAAHPHFAQRHVGGNIFTHLCGGAPKPAACPTPGGTVTGTIVESDITGPAEQGVQPGSAQPGDDALIEFIKAMRAGAVYVNVHSTNFPEGEIRGQINGRDHDNGNHRGKGKDDD